MQRRALLVGAATATTTGALGCLHASRSPVTLASGRASRATLADRFVVLCWNVHKDARAIRDLARLGHDADLVLVQEATGVQTMGPSLATMVVAFRRDRDGRPAGVATATRTSPTQNTALLSPATEPLTHTPKSALVSTIPLTHGGALMVANVHGINLRPADALREQLAALEAPLADHQGPLLVAGDFNTWSPRRRDVVRAFETRLHLDRVFVGPGSPRLDAVFGRGLDVVQREVLPSRLSDHDALRVQFVVRRDC